MLPFLKNKKEGGMSMPVDETMKVSDDGEKSFDMLDAVVDDFMSAIESKDKSLLRSALESLVTHIQEEDASQDETLNNEEI